MKTEGGVLRFAALWRLIAWVMLGTVVVLTLMPKPPKVEMAFLAWDKAQHAIAYAGLCWWFLQSWPRARTAVIVTSLAMLGVALEIAQGAMGVRFMELSDMAANSVGVFLGWALTLTPAGETVSRLDMHLARAVR